MNDAQHLVPNKTVLDMYLDFCRNPLRNDATVAQEYAHLLTTEHVNAVAFYNSQTLMVGTEMISIRDPETCDLHDVGEFIIYIIRKREGRWWSVDFRFENTSFCGTEHRENVIHPHIVVSEHTDLPFRQGQLCIQQGAFHIHQHIRKGEIHKAVPLLINVLYTFQAVSPHCPLHFWPIQGMY